MILIATAIYNMQRVAFLNLIRYSIFRAKVIDLKHLQRTRERHKGVQPK